MRGRGKKAKFILISIQRKTSDAGSQYRCGRVGRGIQPPSTPIPIPNTQTYTKSIKNTRFPTFQIDDHGRTNGRTDKASYRVACPQLKTHRQSTKQHEITRCTYRGSCTEKKKLLFTTFFRSAISRLYCIYIMILSSSRKHHMH